MLIANPYYTDYATVEHAEQLFLTFSRDLLTLQEDTATANQSRLDYIDINTNEDNKYTQIEIRAVPCRVNANGLIIINQFTDSPLVVDSSGTFSIPYPFGANRLLSALCQLGVWLADKELDPAFNSQGKKIISYTMTSSRNIGDSPMALSISARDLPLEISKDGAWQSTRALPWLNGTI